ncbi:MAG: HIT domain-containing protein [Planctomycetota bacterium]|nr:HIT domain-containing protein [Planctomycetota bacterium]
MEHQNLWAPWRMDYIKAIAPATPAPASAPGTGSGNASAPAPARAPEGKPLACFLCEAGTLRVGSDAARQRLVLINDERGILLLNLYPYTNGHLLAALPDHLADLTDLSPSQRAGLMELTAEGEALLRAAINPQGINIGINLGRCAGAGLPGHLHVHIVPRWAGDVNFMQTVGGVRVIPQALEESFSHLEATLAREKAREKPAK